jgi:DNA-directed RNA polymerase specialized sigma24 family protein
MSARARRRLATALEGLNERTRAMLALSRLDGLSAHEIASLVEATPEQVTHDLAIAERALRSAADTLPTRRRRA